MSTENIKLFLILLKLKSYLVSLIDEPAEHYENDFAFSEEFLERKFPERKNEIIDLLRSNGIYGDGQIAFDEKIHIQFKQIVQQYDNALDLPSILEKFKIDSIEETSKDKTLYEIKNSREESLKQIVTLLFHLARLWTERSQLEEDAESLSLLDEDELIRPDEEKKLDIIDGNTEMSFNVISKLSRRYLELLVDYYFKFGGDLVLQNFINGLGDFKILTEEKYKDLFRNSGLDQ